MVLKKNTLILFKVRHCIFAISLFSALETGVVLYLNKHDFPSPKDALSQVSLKLVLWFWKRRFFKFVNVFSLFRYFLPLEKGVVLHLNKLEFPSPKDVFVPSLVEIGLVVLKKKTYRVRQCIFAILFLSPLGKGVALHLNKLESPLPKDALC